MKETNKRETKWKQVRRNFKTRKIEGKKKKAISSEIKKSDRNGRNEWVSGRVERKKKGMWRNIKVGKSEGKKKKKELEPKGKKWVSKSRERTVETNKWAMGEKQVWRNLGVEGKRKYRGVKKYWCGILDVLSVTEDRVPFHHGSRMQIVRRSLEKSPTRYLSARPRRKKVYGNWT